MSMSASVGTNPQLNWQRIAKTYDLLLSYNHPFVFGSVKMSSIPYQPLVRSRREIRLIVLKDPDGGPNTANSPLKCEMITTSLDLYGVKNQSYPAYRVKKFRNALARSFLDDQSCS